MVNSSIEYSGLLITRTLHRYKHQLRDFFNRHAWFQQLRFQQLRATAVRGEEKPPETERRFRAFRFATDLVQQGGWRDSAVTGHCSGPTTKDQSDFKVELPFQSTHVSNHGVHVLRRETMPEPGLIDLDRRHRAAALSDFFPQLRVRLALHLC